MNLENKTEKEDKPSQDYLWIVYSFLFLGLIAIASFFYRRFFEKPILKSELAEKYHVSVKVLMNWTNLLCPERVQAKYLGNKVKKVYPSDFQSHLGKPDNRPLDRKGRKIISRKDICRYFNISQITLNRRLKELEDSEATIGLSYTAFIKLRQFPPRQIQLIIDCLHSKGYAPL